MNKKIYQKPGIGIMYLDMQLLSGSTVTNVQSNAGLGLSDTGSNGTARSRQTDVWGDEED